MSDEYEETIKQLNESQSIANKNTPGMAVIGAGEKYRVIFTSPLMTVKQLGHLLDSGLFEKWLKIMMKKKIKKC